MSVANRLNTLDRRIAREILNVRNPKVISDIYNIRQLRCLKEFSIVMQYNPKKGIFSGYRTYKGNQYPQIGIQNRGICTLPGKTCTQSIERFKRSQILKQIRDRVIK